MTLIIYSILFGITNDNLEFLSKIREFELAI